MKNDLKLIKDTLLYGAAHFGSSILSFVMLPVYTYYFHPDEFGLWDLIMTTIALLTPFVTLEFVAATYRWLLDAKTKKDKITAISTGIYSIGRNLIVINSVAILALLLQFKVPYMLETILLINTSIILSFFQQCARGLQFNLLFAMSGIVQSVIVVSLNLLFMFVVHLRIEALFYSMIIAQTTTIFLLWKKLNLRQYILKKAYSKNMVKQFLTYSLPIIPGAISWWVMTMSDRYMITYFLSVQFNGIFAIANKVPAIILMVNNIFFLAWKDSAITQFHSKRKNIYYSRVFKYFFRLIASTVILLTLLTKPVFTFIISDQFFEGWKYIGLLLIGSLFHTCALFWSAGYHGAKKTDVIFITSVIGAIINIVINFLFIPLIGLYAVGLSSIVAFLFSWISRIVYAKPYFHIDIHYGEMFLILLVITIANIAPFKFDIISLIVMSVVYFGFFVYFNFSFIVNYLSKIKRNEIN